MLQRAWTSPGSPRSLVAAVVLAVAWPAPHAAAQPTYVERSVGLQTPTMESGPTEIEFADVNADGHVDLLSIGDHGSPYIGTNEHGIMVWFNNGAANWSVYQSGAFGYGGIAIGDVNNDGLADAGYAMHHNYSGVDFGNQLIEIALGDGTGQNWTPWDDGLATNGERYGMFATDLADFDNDGDLDIVSSSFGGGSGLHVYRNNGDGTWTQTYGFVNYALTSHHLHCGDIDGDGHADFAVSQQGGTVYLGDGVGGFSVADGNLPISGNYRDSVTLADVDGDGRDELGFILAGRPVVYGWVSPGVWADMSGTLPAAGYELVQLADMDLDGWPDVVAYAGGAAAHLAVFAGDGAGGWTARAEWNVADSCESVILRAGVDADHNGYPDLAYIAEENCSAGNGNNRPHAWVESSASAEPWVHPVCPRGGETWIAGSVRFVGWHAAVPAGAGDPTMTIELSRRGAAGPWTPVVAGAPNSGRYQWRLPAGLPPTAQAHLRFTLETTPFATALTPAPFTILNSSPLPLGDLNCDGAVNALDINPFVLALVDPVGYAAAHPDCYDEYADCNGDGAVNALDINAFVRLLVRD